ncbi:MAG TPA: hypothetical protein P5075_09790 [Eubacteriales bacterium]|nr:hypothetical protein [Eubacteriales bacterium]
MKNNSKSAWIAVLVVLFAAGIVLVLCAAQIGMTAGSAAITRNGGSMDTTLYQFVIQSSAASAQIAGGILAGVSGLGAVLLGCSGKRQQNGMPEHKDDKPEE